MLRKVAIVLSAIVLAVHANMVEVQLAESAVQQLDNDLDASLAIEHTLQWIESHKVKNEEENDISLVELTASASPVPVATAKLTPFCYNTMKTWLSKCVFGDGTNPAPDALGITPECTLIYNTNARECMNSGIMTADQAVVLMEFGNEINEEFAPSFIETENGVEVATEFMREKALEVQSMKTNLEFLDALEEHGFESFDSNSEEDTSFVEQEAEEVDPKLRLVAEELVNRGYSIDLEKA